VTPGRRIRVPLILNVLAASTQIDHRKHESPDALANLFAARPEDSELCVTGREHLATVSRSP